MKDLERTAMGRRPSVSGVVAARVEQLETEVADLRRRLQLAIASCRSLEEQARAATRRAAELELEVHELRHQAMHARSGRKGH